jgi:hypothetical protein
MECGKDNAEHRTYCSACGKTISAESESQFSREQCRLIGSVRAVAASLELTITDHVFVHGRVRIEGLQAGEVEGFIDEEELTLELVNVAADVTSTKDVPRFVGRFDGESFSGNLISADQAVVCTFQFVTASRTSGPTERAASSREPRPSAGTGVSSIDSKEPPRNAERTRVPVGGSSNTPSNHSEPGIPWLCPGCGRWMAKHAEHCLCGLRQGSKPIPFVNPGIQNHVEVKPLATWLSHFDLSTFPRGIIAGIVIFLGLIAVVFAVINLSNPYGILPGLTGLALLRAGAWLARPSTASETHAVEESRSVDMNKLGRRSMLVLGIILFCANILPRYYPNFGGTGGGYSWSSNSSLLVGLGAALVVLAFVTRPKDEAF